MFSELENANRQKNVEKDVKQVAKFRCNGYKLCELLRWKNGVVSDQVNEEWQK